MDMTYLKYSSVAANVTIETQDMWDQFKSVARTLGMSNTKALEQAARAWLAANTAPDGSARPHNPWV